MFKTRTVPVAVAALLTLALTGCGSGEPTVMPDVIGTQLDLAQSDIERAGFGGKVEVVGGGMFGVVDESNWVVCEQEPAAGQNIADPRLVVDRDCGAAEAPVDESASPIEPSAQPSEPIAAPTISMNVIDTSVDELLDRLNSADMGGIQVGDQFRFTGELMASEEWFTGATGHYLVLFSAHEGTDDLPVLLNESDTAGWTDGMLIEMVVENVEITLNDETSDGWLRMVSAVPVP